MIENSLNLNIKNFSGSLDVLLELAKTQKAIEEVANIGSKVSYEIVDRHGKSQKKEIPWLLSYAKNQIKVNLLEIIFDN